MASIEFYAGNNGIVNLAGSGLGFYGDNGFGYSIAVGNYNGRTYITDSTGTAMGPETTNAKYTNISGVILGQVGTPLHIRRVPNYQATLNIRFTHGTPVKVQNAKLYGYDRVNKNNAPIGVNLFGAELVHPDTSQTTSISGSSTWTAMSGSTGVINFIQSPGTSGLSVAGQYTSDVRHDFYTIISASPTTVGSHESLALWFECEYL